MNIETTVAEAKAQVSEVTAAEMDCLLVSLARVNECWERLNGSQTPMLKSISQRCFNLPIVLTSFGRELAQAVNWFEDSQEA